MWLHIGRFYYSNPSKPILRLCVQCTRNCFQNAVIRPPFYRNHKYILKSKPYNVSYLTKRTFAFTLSKHSKSVGDGTVKEISKYNKSDLRRLISLTKDEKWKLAGAFGLLLISSTVTMAVPFALGTIIDTIYTKDSTKMRENLNKLCLTLTLVFIIGATCNFGRVYLMNVSGQRITKRLREKVFKSVMSQETAFFDQHRTGELINRLSADTSLVSQSVTMNISDGLRSGIMVIAGTSMMFFISPKLAFVGLFVVLPVAGLAVLYGRFVRKITKSLQDTLADATIVAEERISNIRTVKSFSQESTEIQRYSDKMLKVFEIAKREAWARGIFYGMTGFSGNVIILSVLYYGGILLADNGISVGNLSSFLLYAAYIGISIGGLSNFYAEMNKGLGASSRLWELIDRVPLIPVSGGFVPIDEARGQVTFKNVVFSYPLRSQQVILNSLDLTLPDGTTTAVVGPSGSGKSTLAALILRLYEPQSGEILFDGKSVKDYDPVWLRRNIGTVSQEPVLFSGTIRDNIIYGLNDPSCVKEDDIIFAANESNALNFINTFPDRFETKIGEKGLMLSGGQKQRIAIARALIKKPKLLLLDEATSALDAESEYLVQEALHRILKGRTVLTIAHRLSTIRSAGCKMRDYGEDERLLKEAKPSEVNDMNPRDQIAMLENGRIVDLGSFDELMSKNGPFKNLIKHQAFAS